MSGAIRFPSPRYAAPHAGTHESPWFGQVGGVSELFRPLAVEAVAAARYAVQLAVGGNQDKFNGLEQQPLLLPASGDTPGPVVVNPILLEAADARCSGGPNEPRRLLEAAGATLACVQGADMIMRHPNAERDPDNLQAWLRVTYARRHAADAYLFLGDDRVLTRPAAVKRFSVALPMDMDPQYPLPVLEVSVRQYILRTGADGDLTLFSGGARPVSGGSELHFTDTAVSGDFCVARPPLTVQTVHNLGNAMLAAAHNPRAVA